MDWTDYDQHARSRPRDDLWGQVRRTVRGRPVPPEQIDMIVRVIRDKLALESSDILLDLACGNGALTQRLHPVCRRSLGVDLSPYMVGIARERFTRPGHSFEQGDAAGWVEQRAETGQFTKLLCYGSLSYFTDEEVARLLSSLSHRFQGVRRVLLGNLPDPDRATAFFGAEQVPDLRQPRSDLGAWRSAGELARLAGPGWEVQASTMPAGFFAAHYRFDLLLVRR